MVRIRKTLSRHAYVPGNGQPEGLQSGSLPLPDDSSLPGSCVGSEASPAVEVPESGEGERSHHEGLGCSDAGGVSSAVLGLCAHTMPLEQASGIEETVVQHRQWFPVDLDACHVPERYLVAIWRGAEVVTVVPPVPEACLQQPAGVRVCGGGLSGDSGAEGSGGQVLSSDLFRPAAPLLAAAEVSGPATVESIGRRQEPASAAAPADSSKATAQTASTQHGVLAVSTTPAAAAAPALQPAPARHPMQTDNPAPAPTPGEDNRQDRAAAADTAPVSVADPASAGDNEKQKAEVAVATRSGGAAGTAAGHKRSRSRSPRPRSPGRRRDKHSRAGRTESHHRRERSPPRRRHKSRTPPGERPRSARRSPGSGRHARHSSRRSRSRPRSKSRPRSRSRLRSKSLPRSRSRSRSRLGSRREHERQGASRRQAEVAAPTGKQRGLGAAERRDQAASVRCQEQPAPAVSAVQPAAASIPLSSKAGVQPKAKDAAKVGARAAFDLQASCTQAAQAADRPASAPAVTQAGGAASTHGLQAAEPPAGGKPSRLIVWQQPQPLQQKQQPSLARQPARASAQSGVHPPGSGAGQPGVVAGPQPAAQRGPAAGRGMAQPAAQPAAPVASVRTGPAAPSRAAATAAPAGVLSPSQPAALGAKPGAPAAARPAATAASRAAASPAATPPAPLPRQTALAAAKAGSPVAVKTAVPGTASAAAPVAVKAVAPVAAKAAAAVATKPAAAPAAAKAAAPVPAKVAAPAAAKPAAPVASRAAPGAVRPAAPAAAKPAAHVAAKSPALAAATAAATAAAAMPAAAPAERQAVRAAAAGKVSVSGSPATASSLPAAAAQASPRQAGKPGQPAARHGHASSTAAKAPPCGHQDAAAKWPALELGGRDARSLGGQVGSPASPRASAAGDLRETKQGVVVAKALNSAGSVQAVLEALAAAPPRVHTVALAQAVVARLNQLLAAGPPSSPSLRARLGAAALDPLFRLLAPVCGALHAGHLLTALEVVAALSSEPLPPSLQLAATAALRGVVPELGPARLARLASAAAQLAQLGDGGARWPPAALLAGVAQLAGEHATSFSPKQALCFLSDMQAAGCELPLHAVAQLLDQVVAEGRPALQDLLDCFAILQRAGFQEPLPRLHAAAAAKVCSMRASLPPVDALGYLVCVARLSAAPLQPALATAVAAIAANMDSLTAAEDLPRLLTALASLRYMPPDSLLRTAAERLVPAASALPPAAIVAVLHSFAMLAFAPGSELLRAVAAAAEAALSQLTAQQAAALLWAFQACGACTPIIWQTLICHCLTAVPAQAVGHEALVQLFQVWLLQRAVRPQTSMPGDLLAAAERAWAQHRQQPPALPHVVEEVSMALLAGNMQHHVNYMEHTPLRIDVALPPGVPPSSSLPPQRTALLVLGPQALACNARVPLGPALMAQQLLAAVGWRVAALPHWQWAGLPAGPTAEAVHARCTFLFQFLGGLL